jgi:hypothetical protein
MLSVYMALIFCIADVSYDEEGYNSKLLSSHFPLIPEVQSPS